MNKIAIIAEAFEANARTLPLGSVGYEAGTSERGERYVWLEAAIVNRSARCEGRARATATSSCEWRRRPRPRIAKQRGLIGATRAPHGADARSALPRALV
jgi:hypothetical protein